MIPTNDGILGELRPSAPARPPGARVAAEPAAAAPGVEPPRRRMLFVANDLGFFLHHFGLVASAARDAGFEIHVAAPAGPGRERLAALRMRFHALALHRSSTRAMGELRTVWRLGTLTRALRPDLVHLITIKPAIYGGLVSRLLRVPAVFTIPGLGYAFLAGGVRGAAIRAVVRLAYRLALRHPESTVVFQNGDDRKVFVEGSLAPASRARVILGSGIEVDRYAPGRDPAESRLIVLPARMLSDKGVREFVAAAELVRRARPDARFVLVGGADPLNPAGIPEEQLRRWHAEGAVEWWGQRADMPAILAEAAAVCLPSYREGLPRVLVEAAFSGRPIVATDAPGCRELVRDGWNGFLVPVRDREALAAALLRLDTEPALRTRMGRNSLALARARLAPERIIDEHLEVYRGLARSRRGARVSRRDVTSEPSPASVTLH
jgi:glycosyltransferase involved in cell wall biosynthesis